MTSRYRKKKGKRRTLAKKLILYCLLIRFLGSSNISSFFKRRSVKTFEIETKYHKWSNKAIKVTIDYIPLWKMHEKCNPFHGYFTHKKLNLGWKNWWIYLSYSQLTQFLRSKYQNIFETDFICFVLKDHNCILFILNAVGKSEKSFPNEEEK